MKAAEALIKVIGEEGSQYVFGLPGTTIIPFLEALRVANIQFISSLYENVSMGIADGFARVSLRPSFIFLHTAPGLLAALRLWQKSHFVSFLMDILLAISMLDDDKKFRVWDKLFCHSLIIL